MFIKLRYKVRKFFLNIRYKLILWLIDDMPAIVNCTVYDDVMEYNFGRTRTYKPCIGFNNRVKSFVKAAEKETQSRELNDEKVERAGNSFVLKI